ncbi:hypothetical protein P8C59_002843 [Phyllachora maydis]|uniref:Chromatin assembly factor 1 subunit A dimerization domain-containing protein n=1 Tax=Phyllachora maydis TaxID=1825666 RepID=A0AAD9HZA0_9PEZI|nr:hypothetical protein P8C59_002843 [Phyllachora maydis]
MEKPNLVPTPTNNNQALDCCPELTESESSALSSLSPSPNPSPTRPSTMTSVPSKEQLPVGTANVDAKTVTMSAPPSTAAPPVTGAKRKRATAEEKAQAEAEKKERAAERERKKLEKEQEAKVRAEAKAAKAAVKAKEDAEKKERSEERERKRQKKEEDMAKDKRQQMKLGNFFTLGPATPKKGEKATGPVKSDVAASPAGATAKPDQKGAVSLYKQVFKPFFVKEHVTLAPSRPQVDQDTLEAKCKRKRGRVCPSVRKIMADYGGATESTAVDVSTESQNTQIRQTRDALRLIPLKTLKFHEDVRPPYVGTVTNLPPDSQSLAKLARRPVSRNVLPLHYAYDSEAEWQEEDGEDVDLEDDEEDLDNDDDLGDFLDDTDDAGPARGHLFTSNMEPESTGLCWEDPQRRSPVPRLYQFRLEFINESLPHHHSIDPFSTAYWAQPREQQTTTADGVLSSRPKPSSSSAAGEDSKRVMAPPAPAADGTCRALSNVTNLVPRLSKEKEQDFKALMRENPALSKVGIVELFASKHGSVKKTQIKASWEALTVSEGRRKGWRLREDV